MREKHTFMDIFGSEFSVNGLDEKIKLQKIVIPIIQRDYAQGRRDEEAKRVRKRFLDALHEALSDNGKETTLDFVYGDISESGELIPLDGQQRLTTLFLLHWYAAKKENIPENEFDFLKNFSYETRYSARDFCARLVDYTPTFSEKLSNEITDQAWFPLSWKKDPTIASMLVMLDAIDEKFCVARGVWEKLCSGVVSFYFLPIKDMGLTDELYIKMNSRGKPLTPFEHVKAEFEAALDKIDSDAAKRIAQKIDGAWTNLLWQYREQTKVSGGDYLIDDAFLRYFRFVCNILRYKIDSQIEDAADDFSLVEKYFSSRAENAKNNILLLEQFFDCWLEMGFECPSDFFASFVSGAHSEGKIVVDGKRDIFAECLSFDKSFDKNGFRANRSILLYATIVYLCDKDKIPREHFIRRIRIVNNLINNSENEIREERMHSILLQVETIIKTGEITSTKEFGLNFNAEQLSEEKQKLEHLRSHPDDAPLLFALEDHPLLYGQIAILRLENIALAHRFESLFSCDKNLVSRALMTIGNYIQTERNKWRHQIGANLDSSWKNLFHQSSNDGFENTKKILVALLNKNETFTDEVLKKIVEEYIAECEETSLFPYQYYYAKYDAFRENNYGKLWNDDASATPYCYSVMQTKLRPSPNTYIPFLKEADEAHISKENLGQRLLYKNCYIEMENDAYIVKKVQDESILKTLKIKQDENGIDAENRIELLKKYVQNIE